MKKNSKKDVYYERSVAKVIKKLLATFPVVSVTGPRQSGKTTFLKHTYPKYTYYNLEDPMVLDMVMSDPKKVLGNADTKVIFDEVQRFPQLLSYIQAHVDNTGALGNIIISGSQNLLVSDKISQSLAGRAAYQTMFSLSVAELKNSMLFDTNMYAQMLRGGYPGIYRTSADPNLFFRQYIATYAERDVRNIKSVTDLVQFQKFMKLLAGRAGQVLNIASLASDVGIAPNTVESWISILEASYIIFRLQPYYTNTTKRLIKSPKIYFNDTGLLCALLNIDSAHELETHSAVGHIFENLIVADIVKQINNSQQSIDIYFYRDKRGNEVDVILDDGSSLVPIEIKLSSTFNSEFLNGIEYFVENFTDKKVRAKLIYGGKDEFTVKGVKITSWKNVDSVL